MNTDMDPREEMFGRLIEGAGGDDLPRAEHRQQLRRRVLEVFDRAGARKSWFFPILHLPIDWRFVMHHPISRIAAATIFTVALAATALLFYGGGTNPAFADLIEPILTAKTATFKITVETNGQPTVTIKETYKAADRFRQDMPGGLVLICNGKKCLLLDPTTKRATLILLPNVPKAEDLSPMDFFAEFKKKLLEGRDKPDAKRKPLGEKEIDGHRAIGYSFAEPGADMAHVGRCQEWLANPGRAYDGRFPEQEGDDERLCL